MSETLLPGLLVGESEFQGGLTGACGPNANAAAARWSDQNVGAASTLTMNAALQKVVHSPNGVSTLGELEQVMRNLGYQIETPGAESALGFAIRILQGRVGAVVTFYERAQALRDALTGSGMDATNLQGHFNTLVGYNSGGSSPKTGKTLPAGCFALDGDNNVENPIINGRREHRGPNTQLVYYPITDLESAALTSVFAVLPRKKVAMGVPSGWKDDGTTLTAPNGIHVVKGFRDEVLGWPGGWEALNWPLEAEIAATSVEPGNAAIGAGTRQDFRWRSLGWTVGRGVYVIWVGQDVLALEKNLATALQQVQVLTGQLAHQPVPLDTAPIVADLKDALTKLGA